MSTHCALLLLAPALVVSVSAAGKRWGDTVAGALAGLPVVAGPVLFSLALERGPAFASDTASASLASLVAPTVFNVTYARVSQMRSWRCAMLCALTSWLSAGVLVLQLPRDLSLRTAVTFGSLVIAPALFPSSPASGPTSSLGSIQMLLRASATGLLVLIVAATAAWAGSEWSGLLAVFPTVGSVLGVSTHRASGGKATSAILRGMTSAFMALAVFLLLTVQLLSRTSIVAAFAIASIVACCLGYALASAAAATRNGEPSKTG